MLNVQMRNEQGWQLLTNYHSPVVVVVEDKEGPRTDDSPWVIANNGGKLYNNSFLITSDESNTIIYS